MALPIWKDYYVNLGEAESVEFQIVLKDDSANQSRIIYNGVSHKRPGQDRNLIRINDICADYLQANAPTFVESFTRMNQPLRFETLTNVEGLWMPLESVQFYNDWSYDYEFNPETDGLAFPINRKVDLRQWIVYSAHNASSVRADITLRDGTSFFIMIPVEMSPAFNDDFNDDFAKEVRSATTGTAVFNLSQYEGIKSIKIEDTTYDIVQGCSRYVLYYVNAHGGWDSFLIEGNHSEADSITRHTREIEYDNRNVRNRGRLNYINEISKALTLHTSWLSDDEASRMHHLLNSTEVFLYDILKDQMIPVILNNTTTEYKTFKSNGNKLVNYAIEVSYANDRIRR